mmetsp:Transcript_18893/g.28762  ORF Transcript_18893/g.28762 Transcript_18893/m.28762 type:complete len:141 (+) Transcript_18893:87-509(+)
MTRLSSILTILTIAISGTTAFMLPFSTHDQQRLLATTASDDEIDFDAPILKNPVMKTDAPTVLDHEIQIVDDECYLGRYGQYAECVDFDPIHEATDVNVGKSTKYLAQESIEAKAAFEMPDFTAIGEEISAAFGKLFSKK